MCIKAGKVTSRRFSTSFDYIYYYYTSISHSGRCDRDQSQPLQDSGKTKLCISMSKESVWILFTCSGLLIPFA